MPAVASATSRPCAISELQASTSSARPSSVRSPGPCGSASPGPRRPVPERALPRLDGQRWRPTPCR
eukprot:15457639-Alexandrium_andersonii.AAC.1